MDVIEHTETFARAWSYLSGVDEEEDGPGLVPGESPEWQGSCRQTSPILPKRKNRTILGQVRRSEMTLRHQVSQIISSESVLKMLTPSNILI